MTFDERVTKLNEMIAGARHIVFFTGAGISTGSGIPDFRSSDGLYNTIGGVKTASPEYMLSYTCLQRHPKEFVQYMRDNMDFRKAEPNIAHLKISELQQTRKVSVITQNIDGLHEKAGSKDIYNIHGTMSKFYCQECGHEEQFTPDDFFETNNDEMGIPKCPYCGEGSIRPDIVLYEEGLPSDFVAANAVAVEADLMIVVGTSLTVYPAATIPVYYGKEGRTIIINRDETCIDNDAALVFHEDICEVFNQIVIPEEKE